MATQLIMTVGTNALPVWVAWHHLKDELEQPVSVRFIYTNDTKQQKDALVSHCSHAEFGTHIRTSSGDPATVRGDIRQRILTDLDEGTTHLHVHYTSGTKVMGVETVSAIEEKKSGNANLNLETTYLDPRGDKGPCLLSRTRVYLNDTRVGVTPTLNRIANLNGFTPAPFTHEYWKNKHEGWIRDEKSAPAKLSNDQETDGNNVIDEMKRRLWNAMDPTHFEYAAYVALKQTLEAIKAANSERSNYRIYHNVFVRRTGADQRAGIFELDVVAALGYQILVVSCTLETGHAVIKKKGMEVILRSRQLGGDEAQAIVLCKGYPETAERVEKELHDEIGSAGRPLRIWGTNKWRNLQNEFKQYLRNDLHWR